jgi:riboflavin biosynthesis pyrimidine reductase
MTNRGSAFPAFEDRKTREAERAVIPRLHTLRDCSAGRALRALGTTWSREHYDGDFYLSDAPRGLPALSLVFVQSIDGNTVIANPERLGGGPADTHLIYEGLSRVAVDAVLAGAATAAGANAFFSVWHPEMVALRRDLGLPRHPAQIIMSNSGRVNLDALLFNVPDVPAFLIAGPGCRGQVESKIADRPWITLVPVDAHTTRDAFAQLRHEHRLSRISVVGGRVTASSLVDAGLVQELHLTTASRAGGEPNTPWYAGRQPPALEVIVKKEAPGPMPVIFEHFAVLAPRTSTVATSYHAT